MFNYIASPVAERPTHVPAGTHRLKVVKVESADAQSGTRYVEVTFATQVGSTVRDRFYLTEKAKWRVTMFFQALGFRIEENSHVQAGPEDLVGLYLKADLGVKKAESGSSYNVVNRYHGTKPERDLPKPSTPPPSVSAATAHEDDDIPF
jgi:hypothetical protein